jgi:hypothetical protein
LVPEPVTAIYLVVLLLCQPILTLEDHIIGKHRVSVAVALEESTQVSVRVMVQE